jgi:hypothetical protein
LAEQIRKPVDWVLRKPVILSEVDEFKGMIEVSDGTMNVWSSIPDPWIVKPEKFGPVIVTEKGSQEMGSEDGTSQAGENGDNI